jgi:magnesium-transporting ATPase (P-type)
MGHLSNQLKDYEKFVHTALDRQQKDYIHSLGEDFSVSDARVGGETKNYLQTFHYNVYSKNADELLATVILHDSSVLLTKDSIADTSLIKKEFKRRGYSVIEVNKENFCERVDRAMDIEGKDITFKFI